MGLTPAVAAGLVLLSEALDGPGHILEHALRDFARTVRSAVSSYVGMTVTGRGTAADLGFTLWGEGDTGPGEVPPVRASLELPMAAPRGGDVGIVLYAANPGAFVDLAADLAALTGRPLSEVPIDEHLDGHHHRVDTSLLDASVLDQAVGVLLGGGWTPEQALSALQERARRQACDVPAAARELLADLEHGGVGWWAEPP